MFSLVMLILMYFFEIDKIETGAFNPTGLRTLRVLRPLRTINHLPGLKALVTALLRSVPLLRDSLILIVFYFIVFGPSPALACFSRARSLARSHARVTLLPHQATPGSSSGWGCSSKNVTTLPSELMRARR